MRFLLLYAWALLFTSCASAPLWADDTVPRLPADVHLSGMALPADSTDTLPPLAQVQVEQDAETRAFILAYLGHGSQFGPER